MAEIKKNIDSFKELNISIAAISTDSIKQSQALAREMELPFDLLCDVDKTVINKFNLLNPFEHGGVAKPAIYLILPSGKIGYRSVDGTARRVDITDLLEFLNIPRDATGAPDYNADAFLTLIDNGTKYNDRHQIVAEYLKHRIVRSKAFLAVHKIFMVCYRKFPAPETYGVPDFRIIVNQGLFIGSR